jgi:glycosyltransferase involved in cell wall biosynthesis
VTTDPGVAAMPVPLVSVVMPVHNPGRFLDAAILSICTQSLTDLELILVDDGSTDGSGEVLHLHAAADPRLSCQPAERLT